MHFCLTIDGGWRRRRPAEPHGFDGRAHETVGSSGLYVSQDVGPREWQCGQFAGGRLDARRSRTSRKSLCDDLV